MFESKSAGNLFLFGEHAVVYGKPAVITSVDLRTKCSLEKKDSGISINSKELGTAEEINGEKTGNPDLFILLDFCRELLFKFEMTSGLNIYIESEIPVASGMSSSTAVLCSILSAFSKEFNLSIEKKDYYNLIIESQKKIHGGKASGSEIISSSIGGFNYLSFKDGKLNIVELDKLPIDVVIGDTGISMKTSTTVGGYIPNLMKEKPEFVKNAFDRIEEICNRGVEAIKRKDFALIGQLINENQNVLFSLGLSHPKIDLAVKNALLAGAYGAKLSGKGQGGIMFAITDKEHKEKVALAIEDSGLKVIKTKIGTEGLI